ncbi:unnamed protein product [Paramecium sonneborni]|uniref:Uncharacterized protein n=1 Tax=Paramecium sonneborni TaxID=65129 RepID=A0A8S1RV42_9CILI|nr:unnamed protein product [Paramecium sonneborni]
MQHQYILSGGGYYSEQSMKIGKWIDLDDQFLDIKKVIYKGEYDNSKKVGIWGNTISEKQQQII